MVATEATARGSRIRRLAAHALRVGLGLALGAVITEAAFRHRDHGAFPHLNVYAPDSKLGARLRPGAEQRIAFGGNPPTAVRIGADGLRGGRGEASKPSDDAILVVGDSQVFGLGVEEDETFSARLAAIRKQPVINAGVPTYGPLEYQALLEEELPKRRPKTVVYVVNLANDLFEARRPNTQRHVVWDGWAVRKETAPASVFDFPGRSLLFRDSHAVFALRRLLHGSASKDAGPLPSEGTWSDLVDAANASTTAHQSFEQEALDQWLKTMNDASNEAIATQQRLEAAATKAYPEVFTADEGKAYLRGHGHPGDIVSERVFVSEAATIPAERVRVVLTGAQVRQQIERDLRARAEAEIQREEAKAILASFEDRLKIEKRIADLRTLPAKIARAHSPMAKPIELAKSTCDAHGARLVVVVLPMDVQVSPQEWQKYEDAPIDLGATQVVTDDIVFAATRLSVSVLDAMNALSAAEPGAFLKADLHMSPKGHQALAEALAKTIAAPPPAPETAKAGPALGWVPACDCLKKIQPELECTRLPERPDLDCLRTYRDDCARLVACVNGAPGAPPTCLDGWHLPRGETRCVRDATSPGLP